MQEHDILAEFDYQPSRAKMVVLNGSAFAGAAFFAYLAFIFDQPFAVGGIQIGGRVGQVLLTVAACTAAARGIVGVVYTVLPGKRRVALTATSILAPRQTKWGLSREEIEIPFESIRSVELRDYVDHSKYLRIEHEGGVFPLFDRLLRQPKQFYHLCELVQKAVWVTGSEEDAQGRRE